MGKELNKEIISFLGYCKYRNFSENTIISYETDLDQFARFNKGFPIVSSSEQVTRWLESFTAKSTMGRKLSTLKSFYDWAVNVSKIVNTNVVLHIDTPKIPIRQMDYMKKSSYIDVVASLDNRNYKYNNRDKTMFDIMFNCGLRVAELVSLKLSNFNFSNNTFNIIGKGNKERTCYMNRTVIASLNKWISDRTMILLETGRNTDSLFVTKVSDQISVRGAQSIVEKFANTHAHAFRHGFCTEMVKNNINLGVISELAGHASISTTRRYIHPDVDTMANAVACLEG
jgi:integrase/recombinase XerD